MKLILSSDDPNVREFESKFLAYEWFDFNGKKYLCYEYSKDLTTGETVLRFKPKLTPDET